MASAQVLRKQNLEAGKKKLEEFRKKKAAEKAKRAASTGQFQATEEGLSERRHSEPEYVRIVDSDAAGTSDSVRATSSESFGVIINNDTKETNTSRKSIYSSSQTSSSDPLDSANNINADFEASKQSHLQNKELSSENISHTSEQLNGHYNQLGEREIGSAESATPVFPVDTVVQPPLWSTYGTSSQSLYRGFGETLPQNIDNNLKDPSNISSLGSSVYENGFPEKSGSGLLNNKPVYGDHFVSSISSSSYEDSMNSGRSRANYHSVFGQRLGALETDNSMVPDPGDSKYAGLAHVASTSASSPWSTDSTYASIDSSNYGPSGINMRRSRPSFLDSINISKGPSLPPPVPLSEPVRGEPFGSKVFPEDRLGSSDIENPMNSISASGKGGDLFKQDNKQDLYLRKQDEDFAALEQHIEDLTQEKFSLQRALEASRTLSESLAAENSALTENFNQQGSVVNQLKLDMEKLQEEIKVKLIELESMKIEYANAQMECNAADERAKLLASEVIGLEEKALRLRSNELKLERQLEETQTEISTFKKKMLSLERERQDLHSTIDALQEEKKLLQTKLRKASLGGKLPDVTKSPANKKDVSTSTEGLGETTVSDASMGIYNMEGYHQLPPENGEFNLEDLSVAIPPDQIRMIENIKTLISELTLEKEELVQALSAESSQSSKLKELNDDLTRKLAVQTQRLELLTSQSMVNDGSVVRHPDARTVHEITPQYADEGDEVVERVLGWIMKLFPGGPSRRRTSKLL